MKEELKKQVLGNATGRKTSLPQWASFILFASQIIRYPVFYLGAIGLMAVTYALLHKQENLLHICAISVALTLVWLVVIVFKSASDMGKRGCSHITCQRSPQTPDLADGSLYILVND